jgi:hypothetical protein
MTHDGLTGFLASIKKQRSPGNSTEHQIQTTRLIEAARWHTVRYDALRASLANRASFVVSVATILIAGISFLFPWIADRKIYGATTALILLSLGILTSLVFAILSVREACRGLLTGKPWRTIFGEAPRSLFYQHEDTTKDLPSYADFNSAFKNQSLEMELNYAITNLWLCLETHAYRYNFIRNAVARLQIAIIAFAVSVVAAAILGLLPNLQTALRACRCDAG